MPSYDYECQKCGVFEVEQKMSENALTKCPTCKGKVRRLISGGAGIAFKGSGFHVTDYSKDKKEKAKPAAPCKACANDSCPAKK